MNFITELSLSENYNVICTIICCFIKEHHYVFCHWENNDILVEETIFINCMIYSVLLFQTETFNSYQLCEKVFASDWESQLIYLQSIILRSTINRNKQIKTLNANLEFTAITSRRIELNEYLWWNSTTISIFSWSLQWFSFTSIKNFTLEWVSIQIWLTIK